MANRMIDEHSFSQLCEEAWLKEEAEGEGESFWQNYRAVPVLFELKASLCSYLAVEDEWQGVYIDPTHETGNQVYARRIGEILSGKKSEPFDHTAYLRQIIRRAEEKYGEKVSDRIDLVG